MPLKSMRCHPMDSVVVAGIMEHIEEAGVHSGDSACSLPPYSLDETVVEEIRRQMTALALELAWSAS